jgi:electron transport complex protein RnfG
MSEPAELTISVGRPPEPGAVRLVATLAAAGLLSGLALAGAYELTRPTIEANRAERRERAVLTVVPGAATLQRLEWKDGAVTAAPSDAPAVGLSVFAAYDETGAFKGYAIEGEGAGFQDTIRLMYGFDPRQRLVTGLEILLSRETPGLGDKIYKDEQFVANFADLAVDPAIKLVKDGRQAGNQVDAITGATISSRAVVKIISDAQAIWDERLPEDPGPASGPSGPAGGATDSAGAEDG